MFKISALIASAPLFFSSWFSGFSFPRFVEGPAAYLLMPLVGYFMIIIAAQLAARLVPEQQ